MLVQQGKPRFSFGPDGELTAQAIKEANLTKEERKRAYQMLEVQKAYLEILDSLHFVTDPDGHVHDLTMTPMTNLAVAYTLALAGWRRSGTPYIKKRNVPSVAYEDAYTWVDSRAPDNAGRELRPEHSSYDVTLPPDTRRLAALRDGEKPAAPPPAWEDEPARIIEKFAPRPKEDE